MKLLKTNKVDLIFNSASLLVCIISICVLAYIVYFLSSESMFFLDAISFSKIFSFTGGWNPLSGEFSFIPMILASFLLALFSTVVIFFSVLVLSVAIKFYLPEKIGESFHSFLVVCNAIPSVVYGFWGITIIVPFMTNFHFLGTNLFSGIIVISVMLIPTCLLLNLRNIDSWSSNVFLTIDSLGLSLISSIKKIFIPLMIRQMPKVLLLAFTRAIGETMAIVMVSGNVVQIPTSIFDSVRVLTSNIALEMAYATDIHRSSLFFSGVLVAFIIGLSLALYKIGELYFKKYYK